MIISKDGFAKLIDFSLAEHQNSEQIDYVVANQISAPEVLSTTEYTEASDWWSFGCLLYEMAVGFKPFEGLSSYQIKQRILGQEPEYPGYLDPSLVSLIKELLQKKPENRLS